MHYYLQVCVFVCVKNLIWCMLFLWEIMCGKKKKKITVIKTNLISQCVHLLSTIPRSESFLKTLNTLLYKFLWNRKPDKIRRSTISLSYMQGGMKMINIHNFDKALKISWIKKLMTQPNSQWYKLMTVIYENINQILIFGDQWYSKMSLTVHNQF